MVTHPEPGTDLAVFVNVTTRRSQSDATVILRPADHTFIKRESVVYYSDAQLLDLNKVQEALDAQVTQYPCVQCDPCSPTVLAMVQQGLLSSKMTPYKIKEYCKNAWA